MLEYEGINFEEITIEPLDELNSSPPDLYGTINHSTWLYYFYPNE